MKQELADYQIPQHLTVVRTYSTYLGNVADDGYFEQAAVEAKQLGFKEGGSYSMKRGHWEVYSRFNHQVPNFPTGETTVHSMMALYDGQRPGQYAILRTSLAGFEWVDFTNDAERINNFYIESSNHPLLPRRFKDLKFGPWLGSMAATGLVVGAASFVVPGISELVLESRALISVGGVATAEILPFIAISVNMMREKAMRRKLSGLSEYSVGQDVISMLNHERNHTITTLLKREIYEALQKRDTELTPEGFLEKVYEPLSHSELVRVRNEEIKMDMLRPSRSRGGQASEVKERIIEAALPLAA